LLPPFDSGEDAFWVGGPDEGFGIDVCLRDEAVDGDLQINDRSEHAALEALARELGEEAFDPGAEVGVKWNAPAGIRSIAWYSDQTLPAIRDDRRKTARSREASKVDVIEQTVN
jgi:hypothetical protein